MIIDNGFFQYSLGCFETIKVAKGELQFWDEHILRAKKTLQDYFCVRTSDRAWQDWQKYLLDDTQNYLLEFSKTQADFQTKSWRFKLMLGLKSLSLPKEETISLRDELQVAMTLAPIKNSLPTYRLDLIDNLFPFFAPASCEHKLLHYAPALKLRRAAELRGFDDGIRLDEEGYLYETSHANLFFYKEGTLFTPPAEGLLAGIIRDQIIKNQKIKVQEMKIHKDELTEFSIAFLTNSIIGIKPIERVGHQCFKQNEDWFKDLQRQVFKN